MAENFCSNCGKPLLHDENFCPGCGKTTVRAVPSAPTAPATPYYDPNIGQPQSQYVQQVRLDREDPVDAASRVRGKLSKDQKTAIILIVGIVIMLLLMWVFDKTGVFRWVESYQ
jgi:predicted nucleic acid-binding Zn ribbon protein